MYATCKVEPKARRRLPADLPPRLHTPSCVHPAPVGCLSWSEVLALGDEESRNTLPSRPSDGLALGTSCHDCVCSLACDADTSDMETLRTRRSHHATRSGPSPVHSGGTFKWVSSDRIYEPPDQPSLVKERRHGTLSRHQTTQLDSLLHKYAPMYSTSRWDLGTLGPEGMVCAKYMCARTPHPWRGLGFPNGHG